MNILAAVYAVAVLVMSLAAFVAYGWDKRQARRDGRRISEQRLQLLSLLGGWPGALLAQRTFRHKTQKLSFRLVFWLIVMLHLAGIGLACYWWFFQ